MVYGDDRFYLCVEVLRILCDSFTAGIANVSQSLYESARLDGAKSHQLVTKITIPMIAPTTFFVFLMELIYSFKIFREVFALFGDYPNTNVYFCRTSSTTIITILTIQDCRRHQLSYRCL